MSGEEAVREVIGMYIESMEKSSSDLVAQAFHENATVVGYLNGDTATAKVRDTYLGITFLDSLTLVNEGGTWSIYCKAFHVEA